MIDTQTNQPVTASLVDEKSRLFFLPSYFGQRLMLRGEALVYNWMKSLSEDYNGGDWNYYKLSNGGFYMAPASAKPYRIACDGFEGEFSADAAGIVATLYALGQLANATEDDHLIEQYHLLRDYVGEHPEGILIYRAID